MRPLNNDEREGSWTLGRAFGVASFAWGLPGLHSGYRRGRTLLNWGLFTLAC